MGHTIEQLTVGLTIVIAIGIVTAKKILRMKLIGLVTVAHSSNSEKKSKNKSKGESKE